MLQAPAKYQKGPQLRDIRRQANPPSYAKSETRLFEKRRKEQSCVKVYDWIRRVVDTARLNDNLGDFTDVKAHRVLTETRLFTPPDRMHDLMHGCSALTR